MRGAQVALLSLWAQFALGGHAMFAPHGCSGDRMISEQDGIDRGGTGGGGAQKFLGSGLQGLAWAPQLPVLRRWSSKGRLTCPRRGHGGYQRGGLRMEWRIPSTSPGGGYKGVKYDVLEDKLSSQIKQVRAPGCPATPAEAICDCIDTNACARHAHSTI